MNFTNLEHGIAICSPRENFVARYARIVSRASPSPREGRVWSTSHHGFVSVCHDFLGVLTTNDAHRRVVARAVHAYYTNRANAYSVWRAPNGPARTASRLTARAYAQTASNYYSHFVLLAHC